MPTLSSKIRVHRSNDLVAFDASGDDGESKTIYLTADTAAQFSDVLAEFAADIESVNFTDSAMGIVHIMLQRVSIEVPEPAE